MPSNFIEKLQSAQSRAQSQWALRLAPQIKRLPLPIQRYDDPFLPFGKALIEATQDRVCAYLFDLAAYLSLGGAGAVALERTIAYVDRQIPTILHGPFTGPHFAPTSAAFHVDAITLSDMRCVDHYLDFSVMPFVMSEHPCDTIHDRCGVFLSSEDRLILQEQSLSIRLIPEEMLYTDMSESFVQTLRKHLEQL